MSEHVFNKSTRRILRNEVSDLVTDPINHVLLNYALERLQSSLKKNDQEEILKNWKAFKAIAHFTAEIKLTVLNDIEKTAFSISSDENLYEITKRNLPTWGKLGKLDLRNSISRLIEIRYGNKGIGLKRIDLNITELIAQYEHRLNDNYEPKIDDSLKSKLKKEVDSYISQYKRLVQILEMKLSSISNQDEIAELNQLISFSETRVAKFEEFLAKLS